MEQQQSGTASTPATSGSARADGTATERAATEIRGLMGARKLNAGDLAKFLNMHRDTAARRMNGGADLTLNELEAIAGWLDVTPCRIISPVAGTTFSV